MVSQFNHYVTDTLLPVPSPPLLLLLSLPTLNSTHRFESQETDASSLLHGKVEHRQARTFPASCHDSAFRLEFLLNSFSAQVQQSEVMR